MARTPELHELLAVRTTLADETKRIHAETAELLGKPQAFRESIKKYDHLIELDSAAAKEALEASKTTTSLMTTTVLERLKYDAGHLARYMTLRLQIDEGNRDAKADLIVDGEVLMQDLPALFLQPLEQWLVDFRSRIIRAPTVQNNLAVEQVAIRDLTGVWHVKDPSVTLAEETITVFTSVAKATDKHAEQVREVPTRKTVGRYTEDVWYGSLTSAQKADILTRIDKMVMAVQEARSRANRVPVPQKRQTEVITNYILGIGN